MLALRSGDLGFYSPGIKPCRFERQMFWRFIFLVQILRVGGAQCGACSPPSSQLPLGPFIGSLFLTESLPLLPFSMWPSLYVLSSGRSVLPVLGSFKEWLALHVVVASVYQGDELITLLLGHLPLLPSCFLRRV